VHSGDSACSLPPYNLPADVQNLIREQVASLARELNVVGLMNTQLAYQDGEIYVIEVNPRASRTVPFVSKCIGVSLAKVAARCMAGTSLAEQGFTKEIIPKTYAVKEAVFPFNKFPGVDPILGPEMKSTGEVMGVGETFAEAFAKSQLGAGE
ncbi:MAG TPA: carbamoyl phosphate synthase large subunit, partial [Pseudohongiella sp.]|nr:carbamoyl phosphate synthase large subunit [Pseudohongiella sp.]